MRQLLIALLFNSFCFQLYGQACCSSGAPTTGSLELGDIYLNTLSLRLNYDFNYLDALVSGSKELSGNNRQRITHATFLRTDYAFSQRFYALAVFSWVRQEERIQGNFGENFTNTAGGPGDVALLLRYSALQRKNNFAGLGAGINIPTGKTNIRQDKTGLLLNPDLQPGTGAWNVVLLGQFTQRNVLKEGMQLNFFTYYWLNNESARFSGQLRYKFGNELQLLLGVADSYTVGSFSFQPMAHLRYRHTAVDQTNGQPTPNTGGNWLYAVPEIRVYHNKGLGLGVKTELPVFRHLTGTQLTTSYRFGLSLIYNFIPSYVYED